MLGIICGYVEEKKIARLITPLVACSGTLEANARRCAEELVRQGATQLLSFGLGGGLSPTLTHRALVIGDRVTNGHEQWWRCDETLTAHLKHILPNARIGGVYGSKDAVSEPIQKRILFERSKCLIVDMESHMVAEVAEKHGLPFAVLRGPSDLADETLPPGALVSIKPNGDINYLAVFKSLAKNPRQRQALMHLGEKSRMVLTNLKHAAPAIKQALASPYSAATVA